jgi:hypothetical protein
VARARHPDRGQLVTIGVHIVVEHVPALAIVDGQGRILVGGVGIVGRRRHLVFRTGVDGERVARGVIAVVRGAAIVGQRDGHGRRTARVHRRLVGEVARRQLDCRLDGKEVGVGVADIN